ncbi:uncharacterized protein LOC125656979 [Ostrea edulis]|uniref:uncharacterized protein LOC125656979 n=1 Tax=Ostrea edulis TaxID=37623 RepID=UPI0024AEF941|nr:uncharacterized protein LOC125656979 [Ostrea edulis]
MELFVFVFLVCVICQQTLSLSGNYSEDQNIFITSNSSSLNKEFLVTFSRNCSVTPVSEMLRHDIKELLDAGTKLIIYELKFRNHSGKIPGQSKSDIYKPFLWERSTGRHGQGLLFLKTGFEILSLSTLSYGTENMKVELQEEPIGCLLQRDIKEVEKGLRHILLNDFKEISPDGAGGSLSDNEHVCNMHIKNVNNRAVFYHVCCSKTPKGSIVCRELVKDMWVRILFYCIYLMNLLVIMFCPYLIPKAWYQDKYKTLKYEFNCDNPIQVKVMKTYLNNPPPTTENIVNIDDLPLMNAFMEQLDEMDEDTVYALTLSKIYLNVKHERLIPPNDVPVGIIRSIYDSFFRCQIRERDSLKPCCNRSVFEPFRGTSLVIKHLKWYHCLQKLMLIVSCILVIIPWIFRIAIFYRYEDSEHDDKDDAARDRKLEVHFAYFPGSMTSFLTPVHGMFVFCYAVLVVDGVLFGVLEFITSEIKRNMDIVLRKCFRDMHESSYSRSFGWAIRTLLYPFKEYGVFAFFIVGIYWMFVLPVIIMVLAFYCIPTLNIALRLLCHLIIVVFPNFKFVTRLKEKIGVVGLLRRETVARLSTKSSVGFRAVQFIAILLSILALVSCVILVVEVIVFFVEMIVYTLIGVILNASQTLKYISLLFMLSLYARDCFGSVTQKYQTFNQAIHKALLGRAKEQVDKVAWQTADIQPNTAFQISVDDHEDETVPMDPFPHMSNGVLKWCVPRVLLFLDNHDKPYITRTFFFKSAYIDHVGCPGSLYKNLVSALRQFLTIILFLLFVIIVVMAFGNEYSVSGVNQMLATLAGGFLPWVFRNVLFKPPADVEVDTSSLSFQNLFDDVIKNYKQNWPVADIIADSKQPERDGLEMKVISHSKKYSPYMDPGSVTMLNGDVVCERRNNILIVNMSTRVKREHEITDV